MTTNWRLLELRVNSYLDAGVSLRPAILRAKDEGLVPDTVVLTECEHPSLQIQYYNDPFKDIDLQTCKELGITVGRAGTSGGGPIYTPSTIGEMGSGAILFVDRNNPQIPRSNEVFLLSLLHSYADQLSSAFKLPIRYKPFNDGEIWDYESMCWKKLVAASVVGKDKALMAAFATFVNPPDFDLISKIITPPAEKWSDKAVKSVYDRSTYLAKYLPSKPEAETLKEITLNTLEKFLGIKLVPGQLTETELAYMEENRKKYLSSEWFFNRSENKFKSSSDTNKKKEAVYKVPGGPLIRVAVMTDQGLIKEVLFTGSFHATPIDCMVTLEEELKDLKIEESLIREKVEKMFSQGVQLPMVKPEDIVKTIWRALHN